MPSQSALSADEKSKVKSTINESTQKILTATVARIYFAHPQPNKWSYGGLQGALAFMRDSSKEAFILRLVDLTGTRGVIWEHELYESFEYYQDRPFFHSFAGDKCMIGFVFADEKDAKTFYKKVTTRKADKVKPSSSEKKKSAKGGRIDKSMISGPTSGSFVHVAHMGYDAEKGYTTTNVDPSWTTFLSGLEGEGVSREIIDSDMDFIKGFLRDAQNAPLPAAKKKAPPPLPAPRNRGHTQQDTAPPPPPPPPSHGEGGTLALPAAPQPGRGDLLASIRGQSVSNLRKTGGPQSTPSPPPAPVAEESSGGGAGGNLTAALAAALLERNKRLGDSDEEDDDDDWD
ncbi:hypothetical protein DEU56DRAFT_891683 [Suillus clintonianus]|uniref:uncharacterized protein n=1 Tax=Suillus clintonianus TaxID=1904413 RepID=UPI001B87A109|nr:uncharacterized protein DEU56DRAFT_891683 [Suillus clintonianus]KAG2126925.1 hypothetical protein DEU56DRAFT_891683 [Suillus clintonianus]